MTKPTTAAKIATNGFANIVELSIACAIDNPSVAFCQAVNAALTFLASINVPILPAKPASNGA